MHGVFDFENIIIPFKSKKIEKSHTVLLPDFWFLKSDSQLPIIFICFNEIPLKMMKNAFYFILKAFFVLKIFRFLSWLFGHVEKTAWLES